MRPRIRSSVGVVVGEDTVEFFKGNTRKSVLIKVSHKIVEIVCSLDGTKTIDKIAAEYQMDDETKGSFKKFIQYLKANNIVIDTEERILDNDRKIYSRVFSMLEDYLSDEQDIRVAWNNIKISRVVIVGIGAVGSWISANLIQSGVRELILIDQDKVDISNIHRQWGYGENDVGRFKVDVLTERLRDIHDNINILSFKQMIDGDTLEMLDIGEVDLVIDCADKPTVDQTAVWIGEYCMKRNIPHIIAGGYNLHVSLIGQTIIPYKTACVKCFEKQLRERNDIETAKMKKLAIEGRKIGSLGPMCSLSASFASLEAIKVLSGRISPTNVNRRGEFNIYNMDIKYHNYDKIQDCEWCGYNGKYVK